MAETRAPRRINPAAGIAFHVRVQNRIDNVGMNSTPFLRRVYQANAKRWMLRGEEQGGYVNDVGQYVGFLGVGPKGIIQSIPTDSLIPNRMHRRVFAPELVRVHMFRYQQTCELGIFRHALVMRPEGDGPEFPPEVQRVEILHLRNGLLGRDGRRPLFFDETGEVAALPKEYLPAIDAATRGITRVNNTRAHFINLPPIELPPFPAQPLRPLRGAAAEAKAEQAPTPVVEVLAPEPVVAAPAKGRSRTATPAA